MIFYMIKNNLKLMLRNKWVIGLMILGPVVTTAILSNVFQTMMESYENVDDFVAGYRVEEGSPFEAYVEPMKTASDQAGITFVEYETGDIKQIMAEKTCGSFVMFGKDDYTIYKLDNKQMEGMITEYFFSRMFHAPGNLDISSKRLDTMPNIDADKYYGIIYNVFFLWCCFVALSVVFASETKNKLKHKFMVTPVTELKLVFAKAIPCILATWFEMLLAVVFSTALFDLQWGNIGYALGILAVSVVGATFFALFFVSLCNNLAISTIVIFSVVWVWGFVGGSFEIYLYSSTAQIVKECSPLYYINRSLIEISLLGKSDVTGKCIIILLAMAAVCCIGSCILAKFNKEARA